MPDFRESMCLFDCETSIYLSILDITQSTLFPGTAIVTEKNALLWTDGRYFLQAEKELDHNWTLMKDG